MGSRYGSLKQMDGVGPNGEAIIDYSIYDAIRAGFGRVVFVIRHLFEKEFREIFTPERFGGKIAVDFVFQELDKLPAGFEVPADRTKPWGTNHAVMMASGTIREEPAELLAYGVVGIAGYYGHFLRTGRIAIPVDELAAFVGRLVVCSLASDEEIARRVLASPIEHLPLPT